jgi:mono/diheme cytochrome c family protein
MKTVKLAFVVLATTLFVVSCGGADSTTPNSTATGGPTPAASPTATALPTPTPDELAEAKKNYAQFCVACHMEKGEGGTIKVEGKQLKIPSLTQGHGLEHSDAEFTKQITKGGDGMPAFGDRLNEKQVSDLVRFIRRDIQAGLTPKTGKSGK